MVGGRRRRPAKICVEFKKSNSSRQKSASNLKVPLFPMEMGRRWIGQSTTAGSIMLATLTAYCSLWLPRHQHHYDVVGASALPSRQNIGTIIHRRPTTRPCRRLMSTTTPSTINSLRHRADSSTPSYSTTRLHLHDIPSSDCDVPSSSSSVITLPRIRRCTSRDAASIIRNCSADDALLIITCDASGRGVS